MLQARYAPGGGVRGMWNRAGGRAPGESEDKVKTGRQQLRVTVITQECRLAI